MLIDISERRLCVILGEIILVVAMILLFILAKISCEGMIFSPQVGFVLGFIPSSFLLLFFIEKWKVDLSNMTIAILVLGGLFFIICSFVSGMLIKYVKCGKENVAQNIDTNIKAMSLMYYSSWKFLCMIILTIISMTLTIGYILSVGSGNNIFISIRIFREMYSRGVVDVPTITSVLRGITLASGYICMYVIINNFIVKWRLRKNILPIVNVLLFFVNELLYGARGGIISSGIVAIVIFFCLSGRIRRYKLKAGPVFLVCIICILALTQFQKLGLLLGRIEKFDTLDYIGIYIAAPIKNLDTVIRLGINEHMEKWYDSVTLFHIINYFAVKTNNISLVHTPNFPFRYVNGYSLGNCYTTYYGFLYDGGISAMLIYLAVMAVICQVLYYRMISRRNNIEQGIISVSMILYGLVYFNVIMSFFSFNFYYNCFEIGFFRNIIYLFFWKIFLGNLVVKRNFLCLNFKRR